MKLMWNNRRVKLAWYSYVLVLGLLGFAVAFKGVSLRYVIDNGVGIVFFLILATLMEVLYIPLPQGGGVSVSLAITLACIIIFGPAAAAMVAGTALTAAIAIVSGWVGLDRYILNFAQMSVSAFLSGHVFLWVSGSIQGVSLAQRGVAAALASIVFFVLNASFVTLGIVLATGQSFGAVWTGNIKWNVPSYFALVPLGFLISLVYGAYGIPGSLLLLVPLLFARYSFLLYLNARKASLSVTQALAAALEAKDSYTKGHSDRVAEYAVEVAREMGLTEEETQIIRWAAEMHDIGKIGVSENLLNKTGSLTQEELAEVREHAMIGANMIKDIDFLRDVAHIIRYHHEWFDGSGGYPRHLVGTAIPLGARILMVCDSFDAMTSDRPYRHRIEFAEAIRRLEQGRGSQFDPEVVKAFLRVLKKESKNKMAENNSC